MIELKEDDVIYKLPPQTANLNDIQIPENATVFDATDCHRFYDLKGLAKYPNLRVLLLKNTAIDSLDFSYISSNVEEMDIRQCRDVRSFQRIPQRTDKPLYVLVHFSGESILNQVPPYVDLEIDGFLKCLSRHRRNGHIEKTNTR